MCGKMARKIEQREWSPLVVVAPFMQMLCDGTRAVFDTYSRRLSKRPHPTVKLKSGVNYVPVRNHYGCKDSQYPIIYSIQSVAGLLAGR